MRPGHTEGLPSLQKSNAPMAHNMQQQVKIKYATVNSDFFLLSSSGWTQARFLQTEKMFISI